MYFIIFWDQDENGWIALTSDNGNAVLLFPSSDHAREWAEKELSDGVHYRVIPNNYGPLLEVGVESEVEILCKKCHRHFEDCECDIMPTAESEAHDEY